MRRALLCLTASASMFAALSGCQDDSVPTAQQVAAEDTDTCTDWVVSDDGESCSCGDTPELGLADSTPVGAKTRSTKPAPMAQPNDVPPDQVVVTLYTNPKNCPPCAALENDWPGLEAGFFVCNGQPVIYRRNVGINTTGVLPTLVITGGGQDKTVTGRRGIIDALTNIYACD
jgi:hypothetical protein